MPNATLANRAPFDDRALRAIEAARRILDWLAGDAPCPLWLTRDTVRAVAQQLRIVEGQTDA